MASLAGITGPGYARRDATLRRSAGVGQGVVALGDVELHAALEIAVATETCPWAEADAEWFERRWSMGEGDAVRTQSEALSKGLNGLDLRGLVPAGARVQVSGAVGARPLVISEHLLVLAAPQTSARAIVAVLLGARLQALMPKTDLAPEDHGWMAEQVAFTAIRSAVGEAPFKDWLSDAMALLATDFERATSVEERVRRIARSCLDQPPGEIERVALGLGRRMESRLDRAIRRGFFVPPGFDLDAWLDGTLIAEDTPAAR